MKLTGNIGSVYVGNDPCDFWEDRDSLALAEVYDPPTAV